MIEAASMLNVIVGFVLGLVIGSFSATLALRWPEGRSVVRGRSACDACGQTLGAVELVPLVSALSQRGKCRRCGTWIHALHWRMELACGIFGAGAAALTPFPQAVVWIALGCALLTLGVLDLRHLWLPDHLTLGLALLGLTLGHRVAGVSFTDAVIGAGAGSGALMLIAWGYRNARGREGLGSGDAKLLGALGAWFGWQTLPLLLLLASGSALIWALAAAAITRNRLDGQARLPLGTFLCAAGLPAFVVTFALM